jgi:hypothetical protein
MKLPSAPERSGSIAITTAALGKIRAHGCRRIAPPCPYTETNTLVVRLGRNDFAPSETAAQLRQEFLAAYLARYPNARVR